MATKQTSIREKARQVAAACDDAYSFDRYASWPAVAEMLLRRGLSEKQAEAVMRSKWARWAGDQSSARYGKCTAQDLARWMDRSMQSNSPTSKKEIEQLTLETFGVRA